MNLNDQYHAWTHLVQLFGFEVTACGMCSVKCTILRIRLVTARESEADPSSTTELTSPEGAIQTYGGKPKRCSRVPKQHQNHQV